jgi:molecular chaperone GrpE (heat shock protein)
MTTQTKPLAERIKTAWAVLRAGGGGAPESTTGDPHLRTAALEMDLRDRDEEIRRLRQEYDRLREQATRQQAEAAAGGFEAVARKLAPLLSQLVTVQTLAEAGRALRIEDVLALFGKVEQSLTEAGLTRLGAVGAEEPFDTRRHQRMSGGDVRDGDPITVRFVGYRLGETVLLKAMVSRQGGATGPDDEL